jgi:hypothetical protein
VLASMENIWTAKKEEFLNGVFAEMQQEIP